MNLIEAVRCLSAQTPTVWVSRKTSSVAYPTCKDKRLFGVV